MKWVSEFITSCNSIINETAITCFRCAQWVFPYSLPRTFRLLFCYQKAIILSYHFLRRETFGVSEEKLFRVIFFWKRRNFVFRLSFGGYLNMSLMSNWIINNFASPRFNTTLPCQNTNLIHSSFNLIDYRRCFQQLSKRFKSNVSNPEMISSDTFRLLASNELVRSEKVLID